MNESSKVHIMAEYVEYTKIIERFTEKKIQDRYHRLLVSTREFIEGMGYCNHVVCNETILMIAVLEYFSEIMRLKDFHDIDRVNDIKILAYETSWILKRKPLQIKDTNNQKYIYCNEQFAFSQLTLWFKESNIEKGTLILSQDDLKFFNETLFYHLKFRNYDPQTLELMLVSFIAGRKYEHFLSDSH